MKNMLIQNYPHPLSAINYDVRISIPREPAPREGFPVLYVLDGNAYGTMLREIVKLQCRRSEKTFVSPMIIVSIGYECEGAFPSLRVYDFTPPASSVTLPAKPDGSSWPQHGGAEEFLRLLERRIKPYVYEHAPVNQNQEYLFGHSLGGLFVLYALFTRPTLFQKYISCSPSIWWNEGQVLTYENEASLAGGRKLFIAAEKQGKGNMFENAKSLYEKLHIHSADHVAFSSPHNENHMSIVPTIMSEALRFCK